MKLFSDKIIDGLFIFVGVYFAFYFDQYQQDLASKRELDFNMTQIVNHLPSKPPEKKVARFRIKRFDMVHEKSDEEISEKEKEIEKELNEKKDQLCNIEVVLTSAHYDLGEEYVNIVKNRGLVRFLEDKRIITLLSYYYSHVVENYNEDRRKYKEIYESTLHKYFTDVASRCVKKSDVEKINGIITPYYNRLKLAEGYLQTVGYDLFNHLKDMGYKPREKTDSHFSFSIKFVDPEELEKDKTNNEDLDLKKESDS